MTCPECGKECKSLAIHRARTHGVISTHPRTAARRAATLRTRNGDAQSRIEDRPNAAGPVALLEAILSRAHIDARRDKGAAGWLADIQQGIPRLGPAGPLRRYKRRIYWRD